MSRLMQLFGWEKFPDSSLAAIKDIPRAVIIYPHSSAWDQTISYVYGRSDPNFMTIAHKFKLVVTTDIKLYEDFARRLFFQNMLFVKKGGNNFEDIVAHLDQTPEWFVAISPKGSIYKREWRTGWYNIAKHFNVPIIVMGTDYDRHEIRIVGEPIHIGNRTYEEVAAEARDRFREIIPLYADTEFNIVERPLKERFVVPEQVRLFYTIIAIVILVILFVAFSRKYIYADWVYYFGLWRDYFIRKNIDTKPMSYIP